MATAPRLGVGVDERARGKICRPHDRLCSAVLEVGYIVALDILELDLKDAGFSPAAARAELHVTDDGLEGVSSGEARELCVVERARAHDGLLDDLHLGERLRDHV